MSIFNTNNDGQGSSQSQNSVSSYYDMWGTQNEFYNYTSNKGWRSANVSESNETEHYEPQNTVETEVACVITREVLYRDPEMFYECTNSKQSDGDHWTSQGFHKAGEGSSGGEARWSVPTKVSKLQKSINKALSQPVQLSKAESMMQKMGWQGGALGRDGSGIVEPIKPNATYATNTKGLGQLHESQPQKLAAENKEHFKTNVLLHLLEFVKDGGKTEVTFDCRLFKNERKQIHRVVHSVISNAKLVAMEFDNVAQMDIVQQINRCNHYVLTTHSEGQSNERYLSVYKEAPEHMYLITPSDLREEEEIDIDDEELPKDKTEASATSDKIDADDDENPFMKSITRNLKKKDEKGDEKVENSVNNKKVELDVSTKICEYFTEFIDEEVYKELRFLGEFENDEIGKINEFLGRFSTYVKEPNRVGEVFQDEKLTAALKKTKFSFSLDQDQNGCSVIHKHLNPGS